MERTLGDRRVFGVITAVPLGPLQSTPASRCPEGNNIPAGPAAMQCGPEPACLPQSLHTVQTLMECQGRGRPEALPSFSYEPRVEDEVLSNGTGALGERTERELKREEE